MKADGKYRFNLQFPADTEEQVQAGELLERAGYRKSAIVVEAIRLYLAANPNVLEPGNKIEIHATHRYDTAEIQQMIKSAVREYLASEKIAEGQAPATQMMSEMEDDISQMLDNLELFQ